MNIEFSNEIKAAAKNLQVLLVEADVNNAPTPDGLWNEILEAEKSIRARFPMELVRHRPAIDATREAYKRLGKEPNRYRPSAEALCRRAVKGMELYRTFAVIDLINLVSLLTGVSIGGFDADKIVGTTLELGVGAHGEPYEAIGRGELNIEGLPVFRDAAGGIGTPTSDNERTKLEESTRKLVMTVNIYGEGEYSPEEIETLIRRLLADYAASKNIVTSYWRTVK